MNTSTDLTVINVPSDLGSMIKGKSLAPKAFEAAGLVPKLVEAGFQVSERNALPDGPKTWDVEASFEPNGARNEQANVEINTQIKETVSNALRTDAATSPFLVVVGGGCDLVPAVMSACWDRYAPKRIGLMYVDADADLTKPGDPASSGNLASMTFTHLTMADGALESMHPFTRANGTGVVDPSNAVIFGLNASQPGNTPTQLGYLFDEGYRVITSNAVAQDPEGRAKQALRYLEERVDHILVHLDVDAIDATRFPLANVPQRTGAGFKEILSAVKIFLRSEKACGLVVAEVNSDHDPGLKMTKRLVDELTDGLKGRL